MENAKSPLGSVELPTGVKVEGEVIKQLSFRELAGPEEDILASSMKASVKLTEVMSNCTQSIGTITDRKTIKDLTRKLVISDRWFYLVQLRILSLGAAYKFTSKCPHCQSEDKLTYDLGQVAVTKAPSAENLFVEKVLPSGLKVRWKIADGEVDEKIERMANDKNAATVGLFARITEINDKPAALSDVVQMTLKDRSALRESIGELEGDFDDTFDAVCPKCGESYKANLELDGRSFFSQ